MSRHRSPWSPFRASGAKITPLGLQQAPRWAPRGQSKRHEGKLAYFQKLWLSPWHPCYSTLFPLILSCQKSPNSVRQDRTKAKSPPDLRELRSAAWRLKETGRTWALIFRTLCKSWGGGLVGSCWRTQGAQPAICEPLRGGEEGGPRRRGFMYTCSCCCMVDTSTTQSNDPPMKNKFKKTQWE